MSHRPLPVVIACALVLVFAAPGLMLVGYNLADRPLPVADLPQLAARPDAPDRDSDAEAARPPAQVLGSGSVARAAFELLPAGTIPSIGDVPWRFDWWPPVPGGGRRQHEMRRSLFASRVRRLCHTCPARGLLVRMQPDTVAGAHATVTVDWLLSGDTAARGRARVVLQYRNDRWELREHRTLPAPPPPATDEDLLVEFYGARKAIFR